MTAQKKFFYGWTNVLILFICYFLLYGIVFYGFSVMFPAMIKALKWSRGDASIAQTLRGLVIGFAAPLVAYMINRIGTRKTIMSGGILCIIGLVLLGTATDQLWTWTLFWGVFCGFGLAASGLVPIQTNLTFWFNKNRGLTIGIVTAGASLGGVVAQPLFTWVIKESGSWQVAWLTAAGIAFVGMIGILWLRNKPGDYGQYPDGISPEESKKATDTGKRVVRTYRTTSSWSLKEAISTSALWYLLIMYTMTMIPIYFMLTHGVLHLTDLGYSKMQAAYALSIISLGGGVVRVPMGWIIDRIEPRWVLTLLFIGHAVATFVLWKAPNINLVIIFSFVVGFTCAGGMVAVATMIGNYFSPGSYANIIGFTFPFQIGFGALVPVFAGYNHDFVKNYDVSLIITVVLCLIAALSAALASPPKKLSELNTGGALSDETSLKASKQGE